ncbi:putative transcription factor Znf-LSD family [Helianthus anomalus]
MKFLYHFAPPLANQLAQVNCGNCRTTLTYPYGAPSIKCAIFQYITNVNVSTITNLSSCGKNHKTYDTRHTHTHYCTMSNGRIPVPVRSNGTATSGLMPPVSTVSSWFFP